MWFICKSAHSEPHFCKQIPCFICTHMYKADVNSCLPTLICSSYVEMQRCTSARFDFLPSFICSSYVKCQHSLGAHMLELSTLAASSYSHVFTCRISARRTGRTDRTDRTDGRTGRTDGQDGRTGRTGRTDSGPQRQCKIRPQNTIPYIGTESLNVHCFCTMDFFCFQNQ